MAIIFIIIRTTTTLRGNETAGVVHFQSFLLSLLDFVFAGMGTMALAQESKPRLGRRLPFHERHLLVRYLSCFCYEKIFVKLSRK
jgi:hypothetical protein